MKFLERNKPCLPALVCLRIGQLHTLGVCSHLCLRLRDRRFRLKASENEEGARLASGRTQLFRIKHQRNPNLGRKGHELEAGGHHRHHGVGLPVEFDGLSHHARVRGKVSLPESVAENRHVVTTVLVFPRNKGSS